MPEFLYNLIMSTAAPMTPPRPYGVFHLCFFILGGAAALLSAYLLRRAGGRANRAVLFSAGLLLALSEIYKQLFYTAVGGSYRYDLIPFQLCSIPMYLCLILPWLPDGRLSRSMYVFLGTYGLMGGAASYIAPGTMCRGYLAMTLHSFIWHLMLIFIGAYVLMSGRAGRRLRGFGGAAALYAAFCAVAFAINLSCVNCPGDIPVNMFYLGPAPSPLPLCRDIVAACGWQVNSLLYTAALTLCAFAIYTVYAALRRFYDKKAAVLRKKGMLKKSN